MRRYESDYLNFKEIFVQPREEVLKNIRTKEIPSDLKAETPDYDTANDEVLMRKLRIRPGYDPLNDPTTIFGLMLMRVFNFLTAKLRIQTLSLVPLSSTK
jgi:hypothetical protein